MNLHEIPFARLLKLEPGHDDQSILALPDSPEYLNHLGTVAAAAQFSLAEFTSGQWLLNTFPEWADKVIPVLRRSDVKFRKPAHGEIRATVPLANDAIPDLPGQLQNAKRALILVPVQLHDTAGQLVMEGNYEWFLALRPDA